MVAEYCVCLFVLCVCVSVCISTCISLELQVQSSSNYRSCYLRSWLGPPLAALRTCDTLCISGVLMRHVCAWQAIGDAEKAYTEWVNKGQHGFDTAAQTDDPPGAAPGRGRSHLRLPGLSCWNWLERCAFRPYDMHRVNAAYCYWRRNSHVGPIYRITYRSVCLSVRVIA